LGSKRGSGKGPSCWQFFVAAKIEKPMASAGGRLACYTMALLLDYLSGALGRLAAWIAGDDWPWSGDSLFAFEPECPKRYFVVS
jgi:hypothetical protein